MDHTEKGWFVKYIDRDPVAIWKQKVRWTAQTMHVWSTPETTLLPPALLTCCCFTQTKEKMDLDDEERMAQFIDKQIERAEAEQPMDEVSVEGGEGGLCGGVRRGREGRGMVVTDKGVT